MNKIIHITNMCDKPTKLGTGYFAVSNQHKALVSIRDISNHIIFI